MSSFFFLNLLKPNLTSAFLLASSDGVTDGQQRNLSAGGGESTTRAWADATMGGDEAGKEQRG